VSTVSPNAITAAGADDAAAGWPRLPDSVRITPWIDPVVDRRGHDPRSSYVERFWLSILGPSATWIMRRFVAGFDEHPDGYDLDVEPTARSLGLSVSKGPASPFARSVQRCVIFGMAAPRSDGWTVRRRMPAVSQRHLGRLPEPLQRLHAQWTTTTVSLGELERAHALARAMLGAGDDPGVLAAQLVAVGVSPPAADEARLLVTGTRAGAGGDRSEYGASSE
jgi:hypothetical protein